MKTALVYDWLVTMGGGEKTLSAIEEAYPAPIHTLVHDPKRLKGTPFEGKEVHTSFIQNLPFAKRLYRNYLPFFPLAIEQFDLSGFDLVISTSHAVAKGVLTTADQLHLCYCLTPMRYAWDLTHRYLDGVSGIQKGIAKASLHYLRNWDIASLRRVDHFAAISHYIAARIKKVYGRDAAVIYPPVETDEIPFLEGKEDYYLAVSRMVPYKRIDLIAEAFSHFPDKRLILVGDGPEMKKVKSVAGKNVEILGWQSDAKVRELMSRARGFLFAAEEDFGIVVVEAQAAGTPVIAFGKGAALETVVEGQTGLFFKEQTVASLCDSIREFERRSFDPETIRRHAQSFSRARFISEFKQFVETKTEDFHEIRHSRRG
ncbi:MAG: glycosyltransferase [Verrucomicrobia bacterium]|nr:glycosyltransferase [Verrucomicrobiota bacterium]